MITLAIIYPNHRKEQIEVYHRPLVSESIVLEGQIYKVVDIVHHPPIQIEVHVVLKA